MKKIATAAIAVFSCLIFLSPTATSPAEASTIMPYDRRTNVKRLWFPASQRTDTVIHTYCSIRILPRFVYRRNRSERFSLLYFGIEYALSRRRHAGKTLYRVAGSRRAHNAYNALRRTTHRRQYGAGRYPYRLYELCQRILVFGRVLRLCDRRIGEYDTGNTTIRRRGMDKQNHPQNRF